LEVVEGIHLIRRVRGANAYLLRADEAITVVDTGLPGSAGRITDYVESIGCRRSDVKTIVLTHSDMDHAGSATRLKEETNAKVAIHEADAPRLSEEKEWKKVNGVLGLLLRAAAAAMRFNRPQADVLLKDSDIINGLHVIHTPGTQMGASAFTFPAGLCSSATLF